MKKLTTYAQKGFSFVEVLLVVVIIGVVALLAVNVANNQNADTEFSSDQAITAAEEQLIENEEDLQEVSESLDDIDLEELDTSELEAAEADLL